MRSTRTLWLPMLLLVAVFALASCGGSGSGSSSDAGSGGGMDHGSGGHRMEETTSGMDHGSTNMEAESARRAVAPDGEYSDAAFVNEMIPHHEGAIEMAEVALENAEHEEIRTLSREIIVAQRTEIEELRRIRDDLGATTTMDMSGGEMEGMSMAEDPRELAEARPFDKAFIDAMTPHHESATVMAKVALEESENPQIRGIAEDIVAGQEREISQMKQWREEWYPKG